jgi:hypothetical protein
VIDNFLSEADLEFLDTYIQKGTFRPSFVDKLSSSPRKNDEQHQSGTSTTNTTTSGIEYDKEHRTSSFQSFPKRGNARIAAIERKACDLLGVWNTDCVEPLQLVRYLPQQFFGPHHDLGDLEESTGQVTLPARNPFVKRRLVTLFCYLNDLPVTTGTDGGTITDSCGGATYFPTLSLGVQPKRGRAVLFSNVRLVGQSSPAEPAVPDNDKDAPPATPSLPQVLVPDERTVHEGSPVLAGIKYGLNIWITED